MRCWLGARPRVRVCTRRRRPLFEEVDDALVDGLVVEGLAAFVAEEDGDGDAPDALTRDAPVGASGDHVGDALFPPGWVPDDLLDLVEGALAEGGFGAFGIEHWGFHADEPLLGGADDDGVVAAPAVRVRVLVGGGAEECALFFEEFDDDWIGFEDGEVFVGLRGVASAETAGVALAAGVVDVLDLGEVVALAGVEVVDAVSGCGVDGSGALIGGDVVGGDAEDAAVEERVLEGCAFECAAGEAGDDVGL